MCIRRKKIIDIYNTYNQDDFGLLTITNFRVNIEIIAHAQECILPSKI